LFVGLLLTFLLLRVNTRLIRKGVSWWPANIRTGHLHLHHIAIGLPIMFVTGAVEFAVQPPEPWVSIVALFFGGASAIVFDEYALVLHLRDVYWEQEGRISIVAIFFAVIVSAFLMIGSVPLGLSSASAQAWGRWVFFGYVVVNLILVVITFLKNKFWTGLIGFFVPAVALIGAVRLGRPGSPWARWFYHRPGRMERALCYAHPNSRWSRWCTRRGGRMERAERRDRGFDKRWGRIRSRLADLIAGAPNR
jgi:hypothetical protein